MANSADPDQTPQNATSDLGLHCLLNYKKLKIKWNTYVPVQDHFPGLLSEAIHPPVLSVLWLKSLLQYNFDNSNTDSSFIMANSNSFVAPRKFFR